MIKTQRKSPDKVPAVSVLMNFHREGYLAQATIASARAAVAHFNDQGLGEIHVVAVIDSGDDITIEVINQNQDFIDSIEHVHYKDLAQSRNHGVARAEGEFVAFLDGDDLWGNSWLAQAYRYAKKFSTPLVLHTEYFIAFGRENFARVQWDSDAVEFDAFTLMQNWHFCNNSFASRALLRDNPFISYDHDSGFGSEDWHWSCETLARGIRHAPVPNTAYFYRMRNDVLSLGGDSHLGLGAKEGLLVRPSKLFSSMSPWFTRHASLIQDILVFPSDEVSQQLKHTPTELPSSIWNEWRVNGEIDPDCYPNIHIRASLKIFRPDIHYGLTRLYRTILSQVEQCEDFIFLEFRMHRETLAAMNETLGTVDKPTALFVMSDTEIQKNLIDSKITVIPLWQSAMSANIGGNEVATLITRLMLQLQPKTVTNLWSSFLAQAVLIPYIRAFETLGIQIRNAVFSDDTTDLFNHRFREEWLLAQGMAGEQTIILTPSLTGVDLIRRRSLAQDKNFIQCSSVNEPLEALARSRTADQVKHSETDISCILNVHREKTLLKPTLLSLMQLITHTQNEHACTIELIVVLDRTDNVTYNIITDAEPEFSCEVKFKEVDNGNLAISRNDGVSVSSGKHVALFDADDLYGRNWLANALDELNNFDNPDQAVIHPQYNVYFGVEKRIFEHKPLHPGNAHTFGLAFTNYWTSLLFAKKELLLKLPFEPIDFSKGYAFEDWSWNLKALRHGVSHLIAPNTAHYIRLKRHGSLNTASVNAGAIYRPAGLFRESFK